MDSFRIGDKVTGEIESRRLSTETFSIGTRWNFECFKPDGTLRWAEYDRPNIVTHEGLDFLLNVMFHGTTPITTWYIAVIETDTTAVATQTYAVPVYTEWDGYTEAARIAYVEAAASSQSITNSANKAIFTASENKTLYGGCLVGGGTDAATWKDTAGGGTLFSYSKFTASKAIESGDTFKVTITITAAHV